MIIQEDLAHVQSRASVNECSEWPVYSAQNTNYIPKLQTHDEIRIEPVIK